jgi:hypothetical protein
MTPKIGSLALLMMIGCSELRPGDDRAPDPAPSDVGEPAVLDASAAGLEEQADAGSRDVVDAGSHDEVDAGSPAARDAGSRPDASAADAATAGPRDAGLPPWNGTCPGYAATHVVTTVWRGDWVFDTDTADRFGANDIMVFEITPSAVNTQATRSGVIAAIEYDGPPAGRWGALSDTPCDLSGHGLLSKRDNLPPTFQNVNAPPTISIWVGANQPRSTVLLEPGVTYYYNITNQDPVTGGNACVPGPVCDIRFEMHKPLGT